MTNKAVFLDRDDTLIEDPGYINHPDQVKLLEGVTETLAELKKMGYKLIVVSNQSGIARGIFTEEMLAKVHERLEQILSHHGVMLDKIYYCPYHPEGAILKYRRESDWRKPQPGMLIAAAEELDIDLTESWLIGDSARDIDAGKSAGCKTILIQNAAHNRTIEPGATAPDYMAVNMKEVLNIIKQNNRTNQKMETEQIQTTPEKPKTEPLIPFTTPPQRETPASQTAFPSRQEELLAEILDQLRRNQRTEMFAEFSVTRLMAGIVQVLVLPCLLIGLWLLMSPNRRPESIVISLAFALVFQVMALTFFVMQKNK
ncbi:MAG: HAD family hydrolase [Phycisphaerae bacterium]|jgi:D-glycero-D-manno-heptose 1,7-bisphosphate phosphatase